MNITAANKAQEESSSTARSVFESLIQDIVSGKYPPGSRLPAERDLAKLLGASRPTLRENLQRLSQWRVVQSRRGSGVVVRQPAEWALDVMPAYLRYAKPSPDSPNLLQVIADMLTMRRGLLTHAVPLIAERMPPGGTAGAREALANAWAARDDGATYAKHDFGIMHALCEAAGILPGMWILNSMSDVYLEIASRLAIFVRPPNDYLESLSGFIDAVEANNVDLAVERITAYLERTDNRMVSMLGLDRA
jgi:GntR family transcriptional repressor for pyruvate dehydrogenase complex